MPKKDDILHGMNGNTTYGEYLQEAYPNWDNWLVQRESYDPQNIFMIQYWKNYFIK